MWAKLQALHGKVKTRSISEVLFADPTRAEAFSLDVDGLHFDFSKTNLDVECLATLLKLAEEAGVVARREAMMSGVRINRTEDRAVLHTALRAMAAGAPDGAILLEDHDVIAEARATHDRLVRFVNAVRSGEWPGGGTRITDVVNIGIGGSDLGPAMVAQALAPYADGPRCHFVSNVDGADIHDTLQPLDPETTLVIVASKTFTTLETMMNARTALRWMAAGCDAPLDRFVALSTALDETKRFGIKDENVFGFGEYIGGRYSVWSPIGLAVMLAVGEEDWEAFLKGGAAMDAHFASAPLAENLPVLLALVGLWHQKFCCYATRAVIPYEQRLARLPAYLQQLEMESNGKSVGTDGTPLPHGGGPVVWGEPGTNGQHAFFQLIHQGRDIVPCEFLLGAEGHEPELQAHHDALVANCLAQSEALLQGRSLEVARKQLMDKGKSEDEAEALAPHKVFSGNRPSTTLLYPKLTPFVLGQIIALYEHRVFVEGVILGLNPYDQWGVELGKELAGGLIPAVEGGALPQGASGSTAALLDYIRTCRKG
ncbi:glucose-6-phosphate isomerase [Shimia sp. FJ5]|uniref:glucose-6-phosphate isomerase n=1 Tax=Shimia sp. FJ5 TaxID=3079054 RepID=UPI00261EBE8A|nr:glucose-6-phosphate isomerase [Shimia sp. FJ5]MDV4144194.1 glucose-6-phosphate isomerase [Shimia sp. FJ5]